MAIKVKVFKDIGEALTLQGAVKKQARKVLEKDLSIISKAAMISHKGIIQWVGLQKNLKSALFKKIFPDEKIKITEISLGDAVIMPAFVECHTHSVFAGERKDEFELRNQGLDYSEIAKRGGGILSTVQSTRKASLKSLEELLKKRVSNFVAQGVTTLEIKSGYGLNWAAEKKILKAAFSIQNIRTSLTFLAPHAVPIEYKNADEYMNQVIEKWLPRVASEKLSSRVDMFVEKNYFNLKHARAFFSKAQALGLSGVIHADQLSDSKAGLWASKNNMISADHLVEMNPRDIESFAPSETTAVLLPAADLYLKINYPRARKFIDEGARVALATDFNPGSSPTQDLSLVGVLARLEMKMTLAEVLTAYTLGGSYALGWGSTLGALAPKRFCDFIVLEKSWKDLFYSVGDHPIYQTWIQEKLS